jgi:hypothetical protein
MSRLIEIALFVTPFLGFAAWRLLFPAPSPPLWMVCWCGGFVLLMLGSLLWQHQIEASDARKAYVPALMQDGRVIPGHAGQPPPGQDGPKAPGQNGSLP